MTETQIRKTQIEDSPFDATTGHVHDGSAGDGPKIPLSGLSDVNLTSPADGSSLIYDDATGKWIDGAPSGLQSRTTAVLTTDSLAPLATDAAKTIALGKASSVIKLQTSRAAWVRFYSTQAHQTADAARAQTVDPTGEHGVLLEVITESSNLTLDLNPAALVFSLDAGVPNDAYATVKNLDSNTGTVVVTATYIQVEA